MSYYQRGSGGALFFFIFIIAAVVMLLFLMRNPNFKTWLSSLFSGITPGGTTPAPPGGGETPAPPSGGGQVGAGQYPMEVCEGGPDDRAQWCSSHPCLAQSGEETGGYITITADGDDDVSIKMRGGAHSNDCRESGCCYIVGVSFSGGVHEGIECPHPDSDGDLGGSALFNPGDMRGHEFGIVARCYPVGSEDKLEVWLDPQANGQWQKFWEATSTRFFGQCNGVSGGCADRGELTFIRLDNVNGYSGASLRDGYTKTYAGGGEAPTGSSGGTTPAPAPAPAPAPQATDDDDDEDDDDDDDGDTPAPSTTTPAQCPASCTPLQNSPASYQACCTAAGGAAVQSNRRRVGRIAMRRAMFSAFEYTPAYTINHRRRTMVANLI